MSRGKRTAGRLDRQGLDRAFLSMLVLGLLLICLPGWTQEEEEGEFKGVGIQIKLKGAWTMFAGGDIDEGTAGMYDRQAAEIVSAGFELGTNDKKPFHNGYELTGDIVYYFTPRIGVGMGGSLIRAHQESTLLFHWPDSPYDYRLTGLPEIKVLSLRLGLFTMIPLNRLLAISFRVGPEYYFADFHYGGSTTTPYYASSIVQRVEARQLGLHGGLGLEIRMNRRLAFCIEVLGRYAKISGFEGQELIYEWSGGQSTDVQDQGTLYYFEGEEYPRLDIPSAEAPGGQGAREAVLDLSGFSLQVGLNFKF
jgi:hypothetical protein